MKRCKTPQICQQLLFPCYTYKQWFHAWFQKQWKAQRTAAWSSLTSMLVLKALLTFALIFTTWPTLKKDGKAELLPSDQPFYTHSHTRLLSPDGMLKVDVIHRSSDAGTSSVPLSCTCRTVRSLQHALHAHSFQHTPVTHKAHQRGRQWSRSIWAAVPRWAPADGCCDRASQSDSFSPLSGCSFLLLPLLLHPLPPNNLTFLNSFGKLGERHKN